MYYREAKTELKSSHDDLQPFFAMFEQGIDPTRNLSIITHYKYKIQKRMKKQPPWFDLILTLFIDDSFSFAHHTG